ncbi:MAG: hypothetical protein ABIM88_08625 [candidate division WOR-3 bacterium]
MRKMEEVLVVLRFTEAEEGELPLDALLRVLGKFNSAYRAALGQIIKGIRFDPERFGLRIAAWEQGSTQIGLVAPKPAPGPLTPEPDVEPELAPERALELLMETWEHVEDEREASPDLLPIVKELADLAPPKVLRMIGPIEVRMPRRKRERVYNESAYHAFQEFLEKPLIKPMILVGKLVEADFRHSKEKCLLINPHLGQIRCSYPPSLEETVYHHLHPFRRNVKVKGFAEIDKKTERILRFRIEAIVPEAELFPWEDKEHLEPTDFQRFVGMIPDMPSESQLQEIREILWGSSEEDES